jgi:hypothetical protein
MSERFKAQGHDFTAKLIVESRQGGHRYYLSAPGIENIAQHAVKYADFSIRADAEQCVSPGSIQKDYIRFVSISPRDGF